MNIVFVKNFNRKNACNYRRDVFIRNNTFEIDLSNKGASLLTPCARWSLISKKSEAIFAYYFSDLK